MPNCVHEHRGSNHCDNRRRADRRGVWHIFAQVVAKKKVEDSRAREKRPPLHGAHVLRHHKMRPGERWHHKGEKEPASQKPAQKARPVCRKREERRHAVDPDDRVEEPVHVVNRVAEKPMDEFPKGEVLHNVSRTPEGVWEEAVCKVAGNASHEKGHAHSKDSLAEELIRRVAAAVLHKICPAQHHEHGNGENECRLLCKRKLPLASATFAEDGKRTVQCHNSKARQDIENVLEVQTHMSGCRQCGPFNRIQACCHRIAKSAGSL